MTTTARIADRLSRIVGKDADIESAAAQPVTVAPATEAACAAILRTASLEGWKVRLTGDGSTRPDVPADILMTTRKLDAIGEITPADLFATADAGVATRTLHARLAESGMWLPADPPEGWITLGAAAAAGVSGPLQTGFGPVRDQVLGLTVVTPEGRIVVGGGRVVKNVAGFDIPKLVIGSFGAFGLITKVHLRLRIAPEVDITMTARGNLEQVFDLRSLLESSAITTAAVELRSGDAREWTIAARLTGSDDAVARREKTLVESVGGKWTTLDGSAAISHWAAHAERHSEGAVILRLGPSPTTLAWAVDELHREMGPGFTTIHGSRCTLRWAGEAGVESIRRLRAAAAVRCVPLTVEDAPWPVLASAGHFGALRSGVGRLVSGLRSTFDPGGTLVVPLVESET